ncbi:MAG: metal-dependent hydrolase [Candidatus Aminicenantia bacterium]
MKIYWLGHSAIRIEGSKIVYVDPFISGNPLSSISLEKIDRADVVVLTHDHEDHLGDAFAICKKTGATLVTYHELSLKANQEGIKAEGMNIGGTVEVNGVKVSLVQAIHSSYSGHPMGAIIRMDGKTVYHTGDTGVFMDMKLISEIFNPDIVFLPIDGRYNMDVVQASKAVELMGFRKFVPIHYDTFPIIQANPRKLKELSKDKGEIIIIKPGESVEI